MAKTAFRGPLLGSSASMAGALENAPIDLLARTQWVTYFNDFTEEDADYDTTADWSLTQVSAGGSASIIDSPLGILQLDCPADEDGPIVQLDKSATAGNASIGVTPADRVVGTSVNTEAVFASRFRMLDVSAQGIFVGLAELNGSSAVRATPQGAITSDTHIGFAQADSDAGSIYFTVAGNDDTAAVTETGILSTALADSGWIEVAVRAVGTDKYFGYIRKPGGNWQEVAKGTLSTGWDAQMLITLANIGGGTGDDLDVDYVMLAVKRDLTE